MSTLTRPQPAHDAIDQPVSAPTAAFTDAVAGAVVEAVTETPPTPQVADDAARALAERIAQLSTRQQSTSQRSSREQARSSSSGGGVTKRKRRHPARKTRIAAAALSLLTTGGLTAAFAATDAPGNSVVVASSAPIGAVASGSAAATTYSGDVLSNKWGPVQVVATFGPDGTLTDVDAVQVPFADGKSVRINNSAVPALNSDALQSQSASVDSVSGATYTSIDYERSLQSAIDAARAAGVTTLA